jgi:hypothetical protein
VDLATLQTAIDSPTSATRALLFAHLADNSAALRAKAAEGLLELYATTKRFRAGLARDFGKEPEAILTPVLDELRDLIGEPRTAGWSRFVRSMVVDLDAWREGLSYDLEALSAVSDVERGALRQLFKLRLGNRNRKPDWRDLDAARALGELDAVAQLSDDPDADIRLRSKLIAGTTSDVADELVRILRTSREADAVSNVLDHVSTHATDAVKEALIERVAMVDANFINAALVLLEVFGDVTDAWAERPFLFKVQAEGPGGTLLKALLGHIKR